MRTGLGASFVITAVLLSGPVRAAAGRDVEVTYFAERALKTEVGTFYKPCGTGAARLKGRRTPFYVRASSTCGGSIHVPNATVSCHFTEAGCSDAIARIATHRPRKHGAHRHHAHRH